MYKNICCKYSCGCSPCGRGLQGARGPQGVQGVQGEMGPAMQLKGFQAFITTPYSLDTTENFLFQSATSQDTDIQLQTSDSILINRAGNYYVNWNISYASSLANSILACIKLNNSVICTSENQNVNNDQIIGNSFITVSTVPSILQIENSSGATLNLSNLTIIGSISVLGIDI